MPKTTDTHAPQFSPARLKALMDERGLSVAQLARLTIRVMPEDQSIAEATVRLWLRGEVVPGSNKLSASAVVLGCKMEDLME